jgi:flagellar hook-associated protein 3 FlgL
MNFASLGDGMQHFHLQRNNTALKTALNSLTGQLSSGEVSDKVKASGGDTARFNAIDNRLKVLDSFSQSIKETQQTLSTTQVLLDNFDSKRDAMTGSLLIIIPDSSDFQIEEASRAARNSFDGLVSTLNTRLGDESLFSGTAVNQAALTSPAVMLADIVTQIGGSTDFNVITATVNTWFDDPAGGFVILGYQGDLGVQPERHLDNDTRIKLGVRADDAGIKAVLKGAVLAAIGQELSGLDKRTQAALLFEGGLQLQSAADDIAQVKGRIGYFEGEVERIAISQSSEISALSLARNLITQADPFEVATELKAVQLQLETHHAMTARLSRLNLVEYLR